MNGKIEPSEIVQNLSDWSTSMGSFDIMQIIK